MKRAFSLVELSIVLVILGLLVGGVLSGQSLIKASELRNFTTSLFNITAATINFRDKYYIIPGDMPNAIQFWGAQDAGDGLGADCTGSPSTTAKTCNGDGSGAIDQQYEYFRYWQHLANAGLITGTYSGVGGAGVSGSYPGTNIYATKRSTTGISAEFFSSAGLFACGAYCNGMTPYINMHVLILGGGNGWNLNELYNAMSAVEMYNIDTKIDDGKPFNGKVFTDPYFRNQKCTTGTPGNYNLTDDTYSNDFSDGCRLWFIPGF